MKRKNILAIILASLVLTVAVFSGCENDNKPKASNNDTPSVSDSSSADNSSDNESSDSPTESSNDESSEPPTESSDDESSEPPARSSDDESSEPPVESSEPSDNESPYYSDDESGVINQHEKSNVTENESFNAVFKGNALDTAFANEQADASSEREMVSVTAKFAKLWLVEVDNAYEQLQNSDIEDGTKQEVKDDYEAWKNGLADKKQEFKTETAQDGAMAQLSAAAMEMNYYRNYAASLYEKVFQQTNEFNLAYNG